MTNALQLNNGSYVEVAPPVPPVIGMPAPQTKVLVIPTPGSPGPQGVAGGTAQLTTAQALGGNMLVTTNDSGQLVYSDCSVITNMMRPIYLTTGAWSQGVTATVISDGPVTESTWSWTVGQPVYLGLNGLPTQTIPPNAVFVTIVAEVINPTTLAFRPGVPIRIS